MPDPTQKSAAVPRIPDTWILLFILACFVWRFLLIATVPMLEAESYYWEWSKHLAFGYFDHPPMIAYVIWLFTTIGGNSVFFIKLGAFLLNVGSTGMFFLLASKMFSKRTALLATAVLQVLPFFFASGLLATPDAPLVFFWMSTLYCSYQAIQTNRLAHWLQAGLALGLALMSKYHAVLLIPAIFLFLLSTEKNRRKLFTPAPYIALLLALFIFLPNLWWNLTHKLTTIHFLLVERNAGPPPLAGGVLWFIGGILLMLSPFFAVFVAGLVPRMLGKALHETDDRYLFLLTTGLFPVAFFGVLSPLLHVGGHWPAVGYPTLSPAVAAYVFEGCEKSRLPRSMRFFTISIGFSAALLILASVLPVVANFIPRTLQVGDRTIETGISRLQTELFGWQELSQHILETTADMPRPAQTFVIADQYRLASMMRFLSDSKIPTRITGYRASHQYRLWGLEDDLTGWDAIFFDKKERRHHNEVLNRLFERCDPKEEYIVTSASGVQRSFFLYRCYAYTGPTTEAKGRRSRAPSATRTAP